MNIIIYYLHLKKTGSNYKLMIYENITCKVAKIWKKVETRWKSISLPAKNNSIFFKSIPSNMITLETF